MSAKKMTTSLVKVLTLLLLIVSVLSSISMRASATPPPPPRFLTETKVNYLEYGKVKNNYNLQEYPSCEIQSVKSSSSSVKVGISGSQVTMLPKKAGKATITVKFKDNGKNHTAKYKVVFFRSKDIFRKVSVDGKSLKSSVLYTYVSGKKAKVSVKLGSGWKVKSFTVSRYVNKTNTSKKVKGSFKNGSYVPVYSDGHTSVVVTAVNKKTGQTLARVIKIYKDK